MLERILRFSLEQRGWVVLLTLLAGLVGLLALLRLPIDAVPDITNNQVVINTVVPAYAPEAVEKQVTFPLESALSGIPGLEYTRSLSRNEFSQITAVFSDQIDVYFARQQVNERLQEIRDRLPATAVSRLGPISTGLGEVCMWVVDFAHNASTYHTPEGRVLQTPTQKAAYLRELQDWVIRPQLRTVKGIAAVDSIGGYERQFVVEVDPDRLLAMGISLETLSQALERNNLDTGGGFIEPRGEAYTVRALGRLAGAREVSEVVVGERRGTPIRVKDVALVKDGAELRTGSASRDGHEVVVGTAVMLKGENSRLVAARVTERMDEIRRTLPPGVRVEIVLDRTKLVDATIATVSRNLVEGALLVIVVLFALLGNFRAALITATAIPLSMLLTAIGMVGGGISGNLMSLGAIDFGLVVDGSVIIVENCVRVLSERQHELGRPLTRRERVKTVFEASRSVRNATAFGEAIIITVYLPILALTGVEGKMFHPMAVTVILALMAAFLLSLTFIPALVALAIGKRVSEHEVAPIRWAKRAYVPLLEAALRWRKLVVFLSLALFALSLVIFRTLGQEFVPTLDEKDLAIQAIRIPATGIQQSTELQMLTEKAISEQPEVQVVFSKTGTAELASDPMPPNISDCIIILKSQSQWPDPQLTKARLIEQLLERVERIPGQNYEVTQPIQMRFNELLSGVRGDVAVKLFGENLEQLLPVANQMASVLREVPGGTDVRVEQISGLPALSIRPDREIMGRLGIDAQTVHQVIAAAVRGQPSGFILEGDRRFEIVVRLPEKGRIDLASLENLPVPVPPGSYAGEPREQRTAFVPLKSVATLTLEEGVNQISRENGKRRIVVQANVRGRDLGSYVEEVRQRMAGIQLPAGSWMQWGGQFENLVKARQRLSIVVPLGLLLIFLLLYTTFGKARQALLVFTGVPLAIPGGVFALIVRNLPFSISAAIGLIALSGVAVLNGLVLVTFINQLRRDGMALHEAVREGSVLRLRPVLMTALVASFGFLPMALSTGTGAEVQRPLATVVIGGLLTTTILTLFVLPALYETFERNKEIL